MRRLTQASLGELPAEVRRPAYDRRQLRVGMAHLGVGAFHRCHQAEWTDDAIELEAGPWGVVGINLHPPALEPTLGAQDGLYSRSLRQGEEVDTRVIGCLLRTIDAVGPGLGQALRALADPAVTLVTLTITEKGYCHLPATGELDQAHPGIAADLADPGRPRTAPGLLLAALERRSLQRAGGLTLISCDNIPGNGAILRRVLLGMAEHHRPGLRDWIDAEVATPSTMVDRIVPASGPADLDFATARLGLEDRAAVTGEPFRQWVIEDALPTRRPAWAAAGVQLVTDVLPYELTKMRLLNAAQSALAYWGAFAGHAWSWQAARDPVLSGLVWRMLLDEAATTLPAAPGMAAVPYIGTALARIGNDAIAHSVHQIATDGSQKLVQRLLAPIRARRRMGLPHPLSSAAVAGWIAYVLAATPRHGARWTAVDPLAAEVQRLGLAAGEAPSAIVRAVVGLRPVFGDDLADEAFGASVARPLAGLLGPEPVAALAGL